MGLFGRLKGTHTRGGGESSAPPQRTEVSVVISRGPVELEVVGESRYQDALWAACGGRSEERVRREVVAVLVPEPSNPHDRNAIAVQVDGRVVGYLGRNTAAAYHPGLLRLMDASDSYVALEGQIVGGGMRSDGPGMLGIFLRHDPADFGLAPVRQEAVRVEQQAGGLAWMQTLPHGDRAATDALRRLLTTTRDPIDRHFQFAELEKRLYRCRDLYPEALDEFDAACLAHDREMDDICQIFRTQWQGVPRLETYHQMAIRKQKQRDWDACLWWIERGIAHYEQGALREDAVEDLLKRRNRVLAKLGRSAGGS